MIKNHGYPAEIHKFITKDGYNLEFHRVPHGFKDHSRKQRPAIILMNGLMSNSAIEFCQGPNKSLGYMLADAGYDVWASNYRGNHVSFNHVTLDPVLDEKKFYDFTFHEIGYTDIPAAIDYITNLTKNDKVFFYGNSLGSSAFLAFGASRPDYISKIKLAILVSPPAYLERKDYFSYLVKTYLKSIFIFWNAHGPWKLEFPVRKSWREWSSPFIINSTMKGLAVAFMSDFDAESMRPYVGAYLYNMPSPTATKILGHYAQLIVSGIKIIISHSLSKLITFNYILGNFEEFDYGKNENLKRYGTSNPRPYNMSNVICPVAMFSAKYDVLVPYDVCVQLNRFLLFIII